MNKLIESTLASEQLVDGLLLKVYRDRVRLPDGKDSQREWIDHPGAAAVVPLLEDERVLLVRQYRYPARRTFLEVPAGKLDMKGEAPEEVAARELTEETGWRADTYTHLGSQYPCIGYSNELIHFYLAEGLSSGKQNLSEGEFVEVMMMPFEEAVGMARRGELADMKTSYALLMAHAHLMARD